MFTEFKKTIDDIQGRKHRLQAEIKENEVFINTLQEEIAAAEVTGENVSTKALSDAQEKQKDLKRQFAAVDKEPGEMLQLLKQNKTVVGLAKRVFDGNSKDIKAMQERYNAKREELEQARSNFLGIVAELGKLDREAAIAAREINEVKQYIEGKENIAYTGITGGMDIVNKVTGKGIAVIPVGEAATRYEGRLRP